MAQVQPLVEELRSHKPHGMATHTRGRDKATPKQYMQHQSTDQGKEKKELSAGRYIKWYNHIGKLALSDMHLSHNLAISLLYIQEK